MVSAILECIRFEGRHTYDKILYQFETCIKNDELENKLFKVVTDSGSNMVKAFADMKKFNEKDESDKEKDEDEEDELDEEDEEENKDNTPKKAADFLEDEEIDVDYENHECSNKIDYNKLCLELEKINAVERYGCAAHNLQLAIKENLNLSELYDILQKVSKLVS